MSKDQYKISAAFNEFFESEKSSGILLIVCTLVSISIANSFFGEHYLHFWQTSVAGLTIEHWVNDALMAIFFLLIGLELEREFYNGELSSYRKALLPVIAACGGLCLPALIHYLFNAGTPTQPGVGIPMATDIAFALGVLALLGNRIPTSLKIFLTALAVIDDLGAVVIIAIFYTAELKITYLLAALAVYSVMLVANRFLRVMSLLPYLVGGAVMWFLMLKSGVHATVTGVLLAFAIPFSSKMDDTFSPSHKLEHFLHKPVAFIILPIFALANTGVVFGENWVESLATSNSMGVILGLVLGKPIGIFLVCFIAVSLGICRLPADLNWKHTFGAGILGGIGFTMSIFITNLAFAGNSEIINASKIAIFLASLIAGILGFIWLRVVTKPSR